ncbi:MAG TPA: hypothetical protein VGS07_20530 [Thermoanaerobaculia bacterium]|jgi:hypothetical protein|nr:hypothetical protein [Thermoanaerobaculia bacterium]
MRDEDIEELEIPPDDATSFLDRLDSDLDDLGAGDHPPTGPPLSRKEIDDLVDRVLDEEVARLKGNSPKKKDSTKENA